MRKRTLEEKEHECRVSSSSVEGDMIAGMEIEKTLSGRIRRIAMHRKSEKRSGKLPPVGAARRLVTMMMKR
ncbi:hypothetical protein GJ744_011069 [Endocarpon pusillum]|uniref:Uncharacterized protein n=1 Tax=Endocarpon pusillum TaxID=364733 RepID=A0A8H7E3N2_9EURO|nr:hypothetical protein GJ744_011069 [Endocarpon pusillum]